MGLLIRRSIEKNIVESYLRIRCRWMFFSVSAWCIIPFVWNTFVYLSFGFQWFEYGLPLLYILVNISANHHSRFRNVCIIVFPYGLRPVLKGFVVTMPESARLVKPKFKNTISIVSALHMYYLYKPECTLATKPDRSVWTHYTLVSPRYANQVNYHNTTRKQHKYVFFVSNEFLCELIYWSWL